MRSVSTSWVVLALSVWPMLGCGPGRLPDFGFGTAADGSLADGSGETASASTDPGDGDPSTTSPGETTSETLGEEESTGDGDDPSTTESTTATTTTGDGDGDGDSGGDGDGDSGGDGDGDSGGDGDGDSDDGNDTWGIPPDVTNEPCEPLTQDCYPTHKCVPYATQPNSSFFDANKCVPIVGDKPWGEPCTLSDFQEAQDDCDGQGFCYGYEWVQGEIHGTCVPFCLGTPQNLMCPIGWGCLFSGAVALCPMKCDPLLQDCDSEYGCYWSGHNFQCALQSTPVAVNHTCDKANECVPGLACIDKALVPGCIGTDDNCCTPWCDLQAPDCPPPLACAPFFDGEVPAMLANVGVCVQ